MIKVSVIVPVYNVENYLKQCLESIVQQTLKDIEIIVVNDGSTDNSLDIINEFAGIHSNIKVLNKENGGLSSARNYGMGRANGEFISFIDSDDFIDNNMLEDLYLLVKENSADMAITKIKLYENSTVTKVIPKGIYKDNYKLTGEEALGEFLRNNITGHAWNKIYKRELFTENNISYPEGLLYEDIPTTVQLLAKSNKVVFTNNAYYYYRQREGAITKKISYKAVKDHFSVIQFIDEYMMIFKSNSELQYYLQDFIINELSYNYKLLIKYYVFTLNKSHISDEHETIIKNKLKRISFLKYLFSFKFNKKMLFKLILMNLNLYKKYIRLRGDYQT